MFFFTFAESKKKCFRKKNLDEKKIAMKSIDDKHSHIKYCLKCFSARSTSR